MTRIDTGIDVTGGRAPSSSFIIVLGAVIRWFFLLANSLVRLPHSFLPWQTAWEWTR